jgi:hypothetical protein
VCEEELCRYSGNLTRGAEGGGENDDYWETREKETIENRHGN